MYSEYLASRPNRLAMENLLLTSGLQMRIEFLFFGYPSVVPTIFLNYERSW